MPERVGADRRALPARASSSATRSRLGAIADRARSRSSARCYCCAGVRVKEAQFLVWLFTRRASKCGQRVEVGRGCARRRWK
jgi:hypothetical protein